MPDDLKHKLVIVEESLIDSLASNQAFLQEFPFLRSIHQVPRPKGCGKCRAGKEKAARSQVYGSIKRALGTMGVEKRQKFKQLLNTSAARVVFKNVSGKVVSLTF